jgi:hypothetical protein
LVARASRRVVSIPRTTFFEASAATLAVREVPALSDQLVTCEDCARI